MRRLLILFVFPLIFILAACSQAEQPAVGVAASATPGATLTPDILQTQTGLKAASQTAQATQLYPQMLTAAVAYTSIAKVNMTQDVLSQKYTRTPTPKPTQPGGNDDLLSGIPTLMPPWSGRRDGTPLPENLAVITKDNIQNLQELARWGKGKINLLRYSKDGMRFAAVTTQGVYIYDTATYQLLGFTPLELPQDLLDISPTLDWLVVGDNLGRLRLFDTSTGALVREVKMSDLAVQAVSFTPDGSRVYASNDIEYQSKTFIWDMQSFEVVTTGLPGASLFLLSNRNSILYDVYNNAYRWDINDPSNMKKMEDFPVDESSDCTPYFTLDISPDGQYLLEYGMGYPDSCLMMWKTEPLSLVWSRNFKADINPALSSQPITPGDGEFIDVLDATFSPDGNRVAVVTLYNSIIQYMVPTGKLVSSWAIKASQAAYSSDGQSIAALDGMVSILGAYSGKVLFRPEGFWGELTDLDYSNNQQYLAVASSDSRLHVLNPIDGSESFIFRGHRAKVSTVDFSPNNRNIITSSWDGTAWVWDVETGKGIKIYSSPGYVIVISPEYSFDGKWIVLGSRTYEGNPNLVIMENGVYQPKNLEDSYSDAFTLSSNSPVLYELLQEKNLIKVSTIPSYEDILTITPFNSNSFSLKVSPDGKWISDGEIIWNLEENKEVINYADQFTYNSLSCNISTIAYSINKDIVAIGACDGVVLLSTDGSPISYRINPTYRQQNNISISPDGKLLTVAYDDGTVSVYGVEE